MFDKMRLTVSTCAAAALMAFGPALLPMPSEAQEIGPPDVYSFAEVLREEIDLLALEMGEVIVPRTDVEVENLSSRYVFFQAVSVFQKASTLCFEFTMDGLPLPQPPRGEITSKDVLEVVTAALDRIDCVKRVIGVTQQVEIPVRDDTKTPTDVFKMMIQANRELNHLLEPSITPSDVYSRVAHANTVVAQEIEALAAELGETDLALPALPAYEPRKKPEDVYAHLMRCLALVHDIGEVSGFTDVLTLVENYDEQIVDGDVYDLVSILMAELHYFSENLHVQEEAFEPDLTRHLPSHVYQQIGLLEAQLELMLGMVEKHPEWHARS